jgi:hypothetical protein
MYLIKSIERAKIQNPNIVLPVAFISFFSLIGMKMHSRMQIKMKIILSKLYPYGSGLPNQSGTAKKSKKLYIRPSLKYAFYSP